MERTRRSRGARIATFLAACLTVATAFGLHPEPGSGPEKASALAAVRAPSAGVVDSTGHDCVACRAHRPLVTVPLLSVVSAPPIALRRFVAARPSLVAALVPESAFGRAPPDRS